MRITLRCSEPSTNPNEGNYSRTTSDLQVNEIIPDKEIFRLQAAAGAAITEALPQAAYRGL